MSYQTLRLILEIRIDTDEDIYTWKNQQMLAENVGAALESWALSSESGIVGELDGFTEGVRIYTPTEGYFGKLVHERSWA